MAKDDLLKQLKGLKYNIGKEPIIKKKVDRTSLIGTKEGETRATFILQQYSADKLKEIAKESNRKIKEVAQEAIDDFIKKYSNDKK